MRILGLCAVAGAVALSGCGDSTPADYDAKPDPVTMPTPSALPAAAASDAAPAPSDAADGELAEGTWTAKTMAGSPAALFGPPNDEALFSVRCDKGELVFQRGVSVDGSTAQMTLATEGLTRTLGGPAQSEPLPQVTARLPASDAFAGVLAAAAGPLVVTVADQAPLRMPPGDALREVVRDCAA